MITMTSSWRCKCGVTIKVKGETERAKPLTTAVAQCPACGDQQVIYAGRILSISIDKEQPAPPEK